MKIAKEKCDEKNIEIIHLPYGNILIRKVQADRENNNKKSYCFGHPYQG